MCARSDVLGASEPGAGGRPVDEADPAAPAEPAAVVLLHGLGRGPASMAWLGRRLARRGHRVIPAAHPFLVNAKGVAEQVDRFLRTGRFAGGAGQGTKAHSEGPSGAHPGGGKRA